MSEAGATWLASLRGGSILTGMQCFSASPILIEAMATAGLDFVTIDLEHCPTGLETVAHLLRAADARGLAAFVRTPDLDASITGRVLDLGACGVVVPHASAERSRLAVRYALYPPDGSRGACPVIRAAGYMPADWNRFAAEANRTVSVIPLIEDREALEEVDDILDVEGIDVVFVGPFDLSISMGLAGSDYRHPALSAALDQVIEAATRRGKFVMTTVGSSIDRDYAASLIARGVKLMSFSADVAVFLTACRQIAALGRAQ